VEQLEYLCCGLSAFNERSFREFLRRARSLLVLRLETERRLEATNDEGVPTQSSALISEQWAEAQADEQADSERAAVREGVALPSLPKPAAAPLDRAAEQAAMKSIPPCSHLLLGALLTAPASLRRQLLLSVCSPRSWSAQLRRRFPLASILTLEDECALKVDTDAQEEDGEEEEDESEGGEWVEPPLCPALQEAIALHERTETEEEAAALCWLPREDPLPAGRCRPPSALPLLRQLGHADDPVFVLLRALKSAADVPLTDSEQLYNLRRAAFPLLPEWIDTGCKTVRQKKPRE
jgi:hypothetical protein